MRYQMGTLLGGLPSMEVRDQKDYIMQIKISLIKPLNIVPSTFQVISDCKLCALNSEGKQFISQEVGEDQGKTKLAFSQGSCN